MEFATNKQIISRMEKMLKKYENNEKAKQLILLMNGLFLEKKDEIIASMNDKKRSVQ